MDIDDQDDCLSRFFKIILEPRQDLYKLGLPPKFMNEYGNDLLDFVSLTIPNGKTWLVELHKENGRAWLKDGWHEFVSYYSIYHGHFLMFTYAGMSKFNVFIFDMTTCEIDYPFNPHVNEGQNIASENEIVKMNSCPTASSPKVKEMVAMVGQYSNQFGELNLQHVKKINSFHFEKPSFAVRMHPSQVTYDFRCNVPINFAKKYLMKNQKNCILKNSIGGTWVVQCQRKESYFRFSTGWRTYVLDNQLEVGDLCVFELENVGKRQLTVEIVRGKSGAARNGVSMPINPSKSQVELTELVVLDE